MKLDRRTRIRMSVTAGLLIAVTLLLSVPFDVRHNAPLGASQTLDKRRLIAVRGGYVTPNYDDFDRVDLDIRAYSQDPFYDLTLHVKPAGPDQPDVRTVRMQLPLDEVWYAKGAFGDPYVTVRFPAIAHSAGKQFYVWVEAGPRNRDDVWTLWQIKSYSHVTGRTVLWAWIRHPPDPLGSAVGGAAVLLLMVGTVAAIWWLFVALLQSGSAGSQGRGPVNERARGV